MPNHQCPRCQSMETRFGYFNNQKTSQPRYFCKACRRYWTLGGKLRDIPAREVVKKAKPYWAPSLSTSSGGGSGNLPLYNGGFTLPPENPSCSQPPTSQLIFTRGNVKSLLRGFNNGLNPFTASPARQAHGRDQGQTVGQLYQLPNRVQGIAAHPDVATDMWTPPIISSTPASSTATNSYTPVTANAATAYTSVASSINWSGHLPSFGHIA